MYKFSLKISFLLLGALWLFAGIMLLSKGVNLLLAIVHQPFFRFFRASQGETAAILVCLGLFLGQFKAKYVLRKTAMKRIQQMSSQSSFTFFQIFNFRYLILIATMISLGLLLKFFHTPHDLRGLIDITIGTALIHSSIFYFKAIRTQPKTST